MTPAEAAADLRRAAGGLDRSMGRSIGGALRRAREAASRGLRATGIGRRVFVDREPALEVSMDSGGASGTLEVRGIAVNIELGQRTLPHRIEPVGNRILALRVAGRRVFVTGGVQHPGGPVRREPATEQALERLMDDTARDLEADVAQQMGAS